MQGIFGKFVITFVCAGALVSSVQTWAHDENGKGSAKTIEVKKQEKCEKPCKTTKENKTQKNDHSQHQDGNSTGMSQMDHSNMKMPNKSAK